MQDESPKLEGLTGSLNLFPLVENPEFTLVSKVSIADDSRVGIAIIGSEVRVYPYRYILRSEIVNDEQNGQKYAFSYCPITKSAVAFTRDETFRASGYLYKDNMAPWDEKTNSIWSQMAIRGIIGSEKDKRFTTIPIIETSWKTVRLYFPNAQVVTDQTTASKESPPQNEGSSSGTPPKNSQLAYGIIDDFDTVHILS